MFGCEGLAGDAPHVEETADDEEGDYDVQRHAYGPIGDAKRDGDSSPKRSARLSKLEEKQHRNGFENTLLKTMLAAIDGDR